MTGLLKVFFWTVLILMLSVTIYASLQQNMFDALPGLFAAPWAVATLADAYCGFLTFYAWVFYRERTYLARGLWLVLILALGNIAMALYMLIALYRLPTGKGVKELLLRREDLGTV